jgi:EAL domain-containing protein (putative c-di-GMP-specific phosphodiesterase class I)
VYRYCSRLSAAGGYNVRVGVNLSPSQLRSGDLATTVAEALEMTGLSPSLLELEVTEDILLRDEQGGTRHLPEDSEARRSRRIRRLRHGFASLSYLKKFPLDGHKIDRSFVFELLADSGDAAIVGSTIGLSRQLGLAVIAEGIENRATADLLVSMGCEQGQGYFFGRPRRSKASSLAAREPAAEAAGEAA